MELVWLLKWEQIWKECCEGSDISTTYLVKVRIVKWFCWWTQLIIYLDHPYKEDHNSQSILPGSCTLLLNRKKKFDLFSLCLGLLVIVKATNGPRYVVGCRRQVSTVEDADSFVFLKYQQNLFVRLWGKTVVYFLDRWIKRSLSKVQELLWTWQLLQSWGRVYVSLSHLERHRSPDMAVLPSKILHI